MDHFAGLDVSVKETSICIVNDTYSSIDYYRHLTASLRHTPIIQSSQKPPS